MRPPPAHRASSVALALDPPALKPVVPTPSNWLSKVILLIACWAVAGCGTPQKGPVAEDRPWRGAEYPSLSEDMRGAAGQILSAAIGFDTTNPPGNERPLAEYLVAVAEREGLESRVVELPGRDRAAAWAVLPGRGARRPIILLSHLDVVPARSESWAVPPFEGLVGGGFVVGRGALDAKGIAVVHLLTLAELKRRGIQLDRDVIFLSVPDEETGGHQGAGALVRDRPELLRDAEFLLAEGGAVLPGRSGQPDVWRVTFTEKSPCWVRLTTRGLGGHGASAPAGAAVPRLVRALDRVRRHAPPVRVVPPVALMFQHLAPLARPSDRALYRDLESGLLAHPEFRERFLAQAGRASLVRDTVAITVLEGSPRTNIVPDEAYAEIDARLLPGNSCADFVSQMRRTIDDPKVEVTTLLSFEAGASPVTSEVFDAIRRVAARRDPTAYVVPQVNPGFTDAHWFRARGIQSYGFVPRWLRPVDTRGIHGPNERISLDNLELGIEVMIDLLTELAGS